MDNKEKYLKYKSKYLELKEIARQVGSAPPKPADPTDPITIALKKAIEEAIKNKTTNFYWYGSLGNGWNRKDATWNSIDKTLSDINSIQKNNFRENIIKLINDYIFTDYDILLLVNQFLLGDGVMKLTKKEKQEIIDTMVTNVANTISEFENLSETQLIKYKELMMLNIHRNRENKYKDNGFTNAILAVHIMRLIKKNIDPDQLKDLIENNFQGGVIHNVENLTKEQINSVIELKKSGYTPENAIKKVQDTGSANLKTF
jgi:hypothetical protein